MIINRGGLVVLHRRLALGEAGGSVVCRDVHSLNSLQTSLFLAYSESSLAVSRRSWIHLRTDLSICLILIISSNQVSEYSLQFCSYCYWSFLLEIGSVGSVAGSQSWRCKAYHSVNFGLIKDFEFDGYYLMNDFDLVSWFDFLCFFFGHW